MSSQKEFGVTRSSVTGNGGGNRLSAQADPEVSPGDTKRPADSSTLPTAQPKSCSQLPSNLGTADSATGADYKGSAPEISCGTVEGHGITSLSGRERARVADTTRKSGATGENNQSDSVHVDWPGSVHDGSENQASPAGTIRKGTTIIEMEQLVERKGVMPTEPRQPQQQICERTSGSAAQASLKTSGLAERIEATISPLQVAKLANGMSLERLNFEERLIYRNRPMEDEA